MRLGASQIIVGACVALAFALLGYTAYYYHQEAENARTDAAYLQGVVDDKIAEDKAFYIALLEEPFRGQVTRLIAADDLESRDRIAIEIEIALKSMQTSFPDGYFVLNGLRDLVDTADATAREEAGAAYLDDMTGLAVFVLDEGVTRDVEPAASLFRAVSGFVTAIAGAGAGLVALLTFLVSGGRRKIETDMLALDLEMKRVELAKARHEAQDALGAGKSG